LTCKSAHGIAGTELQALRALHDVTGPLLPLFPISSRRSAARHSVHSLRLQKFLCAILRLATFNAANMVLES